MQTSKVSDDELIQRYLNGDVRSFETLLRKHKNASYAVILQKVKSRDVADEIFQNVFIKIIEVINDGRYSENGKFKQYLLCLCNNFSIDYLRKASKKKLQLFSSFISNNADDEGYSYFDNYADDKIKAPFVDYEAEKEANILRNLILQLPHDQQEVIILKHWGNLKFREIAEQIGENINTVQGRFRYGIKKLKELMKQQQIEITIN
ncbi:MAG: RNA polymerase sigma factor [Bacteroidia bacterium]